MYQNINDIICSAYIVFVECNLDQKLVVDLFCDSAVNFAPNFVGMILCNWPSPG